MQPGALSRATRTANPGRKETRTRLEEIREATARALDVPVPNLENLHRVKLSSLILAISALLAVAVLLSQVGDPTEVWATVRHADWTWVGLALALSLLTNLPFAVALMGCVPRRLPLWPTTEVQVAMSYTNLAVPSVGGLALQVRYLQRQGVALASAVAAGGLLSMIGSVGTQIGLFFVAAWLSPDSIDLSALPVTGIALTALGAALLFGVVVGVALGIPPLRRRFLDPVLSAASTVWSTMRSGRQMSLLIVGNLGANALYAACLLACLRAFGGGVSSWTALACITAVTTITGVIPVPGGATALASVGLSGALTTFGVPAEIAVPAVLTNQLVTMYLPALPGWFATRHLIQRDDLYSGGLSKNLRWRTS
jgi:undecaprenyl-diphosphatase